MVARVGLALVLLSAGCGRGGFRLKDISLAVEPGTVRVVAQVGEPVEPVAVSLVDANRLVVSWRAVSDAAWLSIEPAAGTTPSLIHITADTRGLAPGVHQAGVAFEIAEDAPGEGSSVFVQLELSAPGWTEVAGVQCGDVLSIAYDPANPDRILAGNAYGDIHLSADGGATFSTIRLGSSDEIESLVLLPSGRGYAGGEGFFRSDDRGSTWSLVGLGNVEIDYVAVDPGDQDIVLVEGDDGVYRTRDGGSNWETVAVNTSTYALHNEPGAPGNYIVAGSSGELYRTDSGMGSGLTPLPNTGFGYAVGDFAATASGRWFTVQYGCTSDSVRIRASDDRGSSWFEPGGAGLAGEQFDVRPRLATVGDDLYVLHHEVYRSTDQGATFSQIPRSFTSPEFRNLHHVLVDHPAGLLVGHQRLGLLRNTAGMLEPLQLTHCHFDEIRVLANGDIYALSDMGLSRWRNGTLTGLGEGGLQSSGYLDLTIDPRSPNVIAIGTYEWNLQLTRDGGQTWTDSVPGLNFMCSLSPHRAPDNPDVVWVTGFSDGLFVRTDNALSFAEVGNISSWVGQALPGNRFIYNDLITDELVIADAGGGQTVVLGLSSSVDVIEHTADGAIWVLDGGVLRSGDGGSTWQSLGLGGAEFFALVADPANPSHVFVSTRTDVFESTDGGQTWTAAGSPFSPRGLAFDPAAGDLVVGTAEGGLYRYRP